MKIKNLFLILLFLTGISAYSQDSDSKDVVIKRHHRVKIGVGINIPMSPNSVSHDIGMGVGEQYEFLLWDHFSLIQSLSYNFVSGKSVQEYYQNQDVITQYHAFHTVPFQLGVGWYFGESQSKFYILFKGGISYYWGANAAYPEIVVNGNVVKEAIPSEDFDGTFSFFTPSIGWQFKRASISLVYQGTVNKDTKLNVLSIDLGFRLY